MSCSHKFVTTQIYNPIVARQCCEKCGVKIICTRKTPETYEWKKQSWSDGWSPKFMEENGYETIYTDMEKGFMK